MLEKYKSEIMPYIKEIISTEKVQEMKGYIQHGSITTFEHCMSVALMSYAIVKFFHIEVALKTLLVGAILHDFYLYDWHKNKDNKVKFFDKHGFKHPIKAKENAIKYFNISEEEQHIIESHMFPLTISLVPKSKEAWIVSIADKCCATKETLFMRRVKLRRVA